MGTMKPFKGLFSKDGKLCRAFQLRYNSGSYDYVTTLYEYEGSIWTDYGSLMLIDSTEIKEASEKETSKEKTHPKITDFFDGKLRNITLEVSFQDER